MLRAATHPALLGATILFVAGAIVGTVASPAISSLGVAKLGGGVAPLATTTTTRATPTPATIRRGSKSTPGDDTRHRKKKDDDDDDDDSSSDSDEARSISHWSPYDRVGVVNADP
jgi:hypothetical protein